MRLSEKREWDLRDAIHFPTIGVRVELSKRGLSRKDDILIGQLEHKIWARVKKALNLKEA